MNNQPETNKAVATKFNKGFIEGGDMNVFNFAVGFFNLVGRDLNFFTTSYLHR
jgi:hypothetical protein